MAEAPDKYRLRPFIADDDSNGTKDSVLVIRGFRDREDVQAFLDKITDGGVVDPTPARN